MTQAPQAASSGQLVARLPLIHPADPSLVRIARAEDVDGLMVLARLMHAEVGVFRLNPQKLADTVDLGIKHRLIGVIGPVGAPVGVMCLAINSMFYTDDFRLVDMFFFVHPDHRRSAHARSLLEWGKRTREAIGVPLFVGIFNTDRTEAKARMMERQLEFCGATFVHGLAVPHAPDLEGAS